MENEQPQREMTPLTEWQALNVAINALHTMIYHAEIGRHALTDAAQNPDLKEAKRLLEQVQQRTPRR